MWLCKLGSLVKIKSVVLLKVKVTRVGDIISCTRPNSSSILVTLYFSALAPCFYNFIGNNRILVKISDHIINNTRKMFSEKPIVALTDSTVFILDLIIYD